LYNIFVTPFEQLSLSYLYDVLTSLFVFLSLLFFINKKRKNYHSS